MSFREVRNFTEIMKTLGYPRIISLENFRSPNFPLVSEILEWLIKRFDPSSANMLPIGAEKEQDRVIFIRTVAQLLANKAHVKVNTKKLYQADGYAVRELLKVATLLYDASKRQKIGLHENREEADDQFTHFNDLSSKVTNIKYCRQLVSEVTSTGAALFDLLNRESELREARISALGQQIELPEIEKALQKEVENIQTEIDKTLEAIENVASDEVNLDAKIERKRLELDRTQKRLHTLSKVRPAYMDEYEKIEIELTSVYEEYVLKYRCLAFLEQQLEELEKQEKEKQSEQDQKLKKLLEKMQLEESAFDSEDRIDIQETIGKSASLQRPPPAKRYAGQGSRTDATGTRRVYGSMTAAEEEDEEDSLIGDSQLSDSDLELDGDDDGELIGSDDEMELGRKQRSKVGVPKENEANLSDDNF